MRCECPNEKTIWIAMASTAHHDPNRRLVRTQRIQLHAHATSVTEAKSPKRSVDLKPLVLWRSGIGGVNGRLPPRNARFGPLRVRQMVAISTLQAQRLSQRSERSSHLLKGRH